MQQPGDGRGMRVLQRQRRGVLPEGNFRCRKQESKGPDQHQRETSTIYTFCTFFFPPCAKRENALSFTQRIANNGKEENLE